jgi:hypothetical protein
MELEGIDPSVVDKNLKELVSLKEQSDNGKIPIGEHPKYAKYLV